jgi:hypothetical protein
MAQAIRTTGSYTYITARCAAKTIKVINRGVSEAVAHRDAAEYLISLMGWNEPNHGTLVSGCLPDGSYCHVLTGRDGKGN